MLKIYDINTDSYREATQEDIDLMEKFISAVAVRSQPLENTQPPPEGFTFRLACYPNRMRDDGLYVGEEKEIEPYEGLTDPRTGGPVYPSVPQTPWTLKHQLPVEFAKELVRRWNAFSKEP